MKVAVLLGLAALAAVVLAGCSSSPPASFVTPAKDAEGHYALKATAANTFSPRNAQVPVGSTVTWTSDGTHNVEGGPLSSGQLNTGKTYSYTFDTVGSYDYKCTYHTGMVGTVKVV